jgi:hypothetical protein
VSRSTGIKHGEAEQSASLFLWVRDEGDFVLLWRGKGKFLRVIKSNNEIKENKLLALFFPFFNCDTYNSQTILQALSWCIFDLVFIHRIYNFLCGIYDYLHKE